MQQTGGFLSRSMGRCLRGLLTAILLGALAVNLIAPLRAEAASATVEGKVAAGSTDDLLKLDTNQGQMLIKMDSNVNISGGAMVIGAKVKVDVETGTDRYLHTNKITVSGTNWGAVVDTANTITVTGKIMSGSTESTVLFAFSGSQFNLRIDATTEFKGVHIIEKDREVEVTVARGSDAYLHALRISGNPTVSTVSAMADIPAKTSDGRTISVVNGVVQSGSTDSNLVIKVSGNLFNVKIDSSTDITQIHALVPEATIGLAVYVGADGAFHAYKMVGSIETAEPNRSGNTATVSGTVQKNTTDKILYLKTSAGDMIIKLDKDTDIGTTGLLVVGKTVQVTVQRGSDAYLHATKISGNGSSSSSTTTASAQMSPEAEKTSESVKVQGTVESNTTNAVLYLKVSGSVMQIRIDRNTKWPESDALKTGESITAMVYRGSDAYLHAESVTADTECAPSAVINTASKLTFKGNVEKIDGYTITIKNGDNTYTFRFDDDTDFSGFRLLQKNKTVTVEAATGSDGYWRATMVTM